MRAEMLVLVCSFALFIVVNGSPFHKGVLTKNSVSSNSFGKDVPVNTNKHQSELDSNDDTVDDEVYAEEVAQGDTDLAQLESPVYVQPIGSSQSLKTERKISLDEAPYHRGVIFEKDPNFKKYHLYKISKYTYKDYFILPKQARQPFPFMTHLNREI